MIDKPENITELKQKVKDTIAKEKETAEKKPKEPLEPIIMARPMDRFHVLDGFSKHNVYFIDMETGEYIDGFISVPMIGLTLTPPPPKESISDFGFLALPGKKNKNSTNDIEPGTFEIDAVLYFEYNGSECTTGFLEDGSCLYFLKIWNDIDMRLWLDIIEKIVAENTYVEEKVAHHIVQFVVSSVFVPQHPTETNRLVLSRKSPAGDMTHAISTDRIHQEEDYYEDRIRKKYTPA